ncbi:hypothetical protein SAMN04489733_0283 [Amycolatopsis keratiniphila]|nr:hypothetical protein SAMN04489733_0283 [Amycolatopsis keratiniphila]
MLATATATASAAVRHRAIVRDGFLRPVDAVPTAL